MEIVWTLEAEQQLEAMAAYYLQAAGTLTAGSMMQRITDTVACLADSPHIGQYVEGRGKAYRAVMVPPYGKVIYRVVGNKVVVVAVWDCRRDPSA